MGIMHKDGRFYAATSGGDAELLYRIEGPMMIVYHTFVPESERGRGLAEELATRAFEFAKKERLKVRPDCPYIPRFLEKHPEFKTDSV